jgi:phytanoyl-CoA hydroxylase
VSTLSPEQWRLFEEQGYVRLGAVLADGEFTALKEEIDKIMLGTSAADYQRLMMERDQAGQPDVAFGYSEGFKGPSLDYKRIEGLEHVPIFREYIRNSLFRDVCARAYGRGTPISVFRVMMLNKPASGGVQLKWHQDFWSYLDRQPIITTWLALDPVTPAKGCLQIVPGSHLLGHLNEDDPSGFLTDALTADHCQERNVVTLEMAAGEVVVLHNGLLHASTRNNTNQRRRALSVCYMHGAAKDRNTLHTYPIVFSDVNERQQSLARRETATQRRGARTGQ